MSAKPWTNEDLAGIRERQAHASTLLGWCPGSTAKWLVTLDAERAKSAELLKALRAVIETRAAYDGESSWSLESRWSVYVIARDAAVALLKRLK